MKHATFKNRYALVGTGHRGTGMWGKGLLKGWSDHVELVGICDLNTLRAERSREMMNSTAPIYADLDEMLARHQPDTVIVCTRDSDHDEIIVKALAAGANVVSEKPLTTTVDKIHRILDAEKASGKRVDVSFNYRFAPLSARIKELILSGAIGTVTSVDFQWFLDTTHGAAYFRRWHAYEGSSGGLFVHKATHHFDLLNWFLDADPVSVSALASQRKYGKAGPFRSTRCKGCPHAGECEFFFDITKNDYLSALYEDPSNIDGYVRDACVYREDIDIPDTMSAVVRFSNGVQATYSLNTYMPIEGHDLAINGTHGRLEIRQYHRQPWTEPPADEILVIRNFGGVERIWVPHYSGGHFGGDDRLRDALFKPGTPDPLGQRAGSRAGAMSVLTGLAAVQSSRQGGRDVRIADLATIA
ncbi:Gfo/Idh/MocA family protein [Devosia sediminis]|uniref:Gfo/Idh/MocA family oxidoreductase n=1 Tax=Devosia sediminis TaxID=2798801 RepID=A0A934J0Y7_9HYPH|nr:Gfo/Idh/MocA family oxidoreductase [Devosia sediminis]MBJ3785832.1 Gfo/Idh/MocA family oxidoreductase [Devosia sediminis]